MNVDTYIASLVQYGLDCGLLETCDRIYVTNQLLQVLGLDSYAVAKIISAMVNKPRFAEAIQAKIGTAVDTATLEQQVEVLQGRLKQTLGTKTRLERQMDTLDIGDPHYDRKISDSLHFCACMIQKKTFCLKKICPKLWH